MQREEAWEVILMATSEDIMENDVLKKYSRLPAWAAVTHSEGIRFELQPGTDLFLC
jgi:hypothetical protein